MSMRDDARRVADELRGLASALHWLRLEAQRESDHGRGSPWHTKLEDRLAVLVDDADHCNQTVDKLARNLMLDEAHEGEADKVSAESQV
jgi:hypothetical protein